VELPLVVRPLPPLQVERLERLAAPRDPVEPARVGVGPDPLIEQRVYGGHELRVLYAVRGLPRVVKGLKRGRGRHMDARAQGWQRQCAWVHTD